MKFGPALSPRQHGPVASSLSAMPDSATIVTLKWGTRYSADFVNRLYRAVQRHLQRPHRFVCFTDDASGLDPHVDAFPIPELALPAKSMSTGWRKLALFQPNLPLSGPCLFLDLDIIVRGNLDVFFDFAPQQIPIIHNWTNGLSNLLGRRPAIGNSSVFRFPANACGHIVTQYLAEQEWAHANFHPPQTYLTHAIRPQMTFWPESWVRSFKRHCRPLFPLNLMLPPHLPKDARIIAFHGRPDPDEAEHGFHGKKLHHHTRPCPWITENWY